MRLPQSTRQTRARRRCAITQRLKTFIILWSLKLAERIGSLGLKLHTGRSRNEQIATDLRLYVREQIDLTRGALIAWAKRWSRRLQAAGDAVMPSYTHLQRAEPVLVAHWLLAYVEMILRDAARLMDCKAAAQLLSAWFGRSGRRNARARPHDCRERVGFHRADCAIRWTRPATAILFWNTCRR